LTPTRRQPHNERSPETGPPARAGLGSRFAAIATALRRDIHSGTLGPGAAVPSEAQLSAQYGVSRGTVRQALAALRAEGLIVGGRGRSPRVTRSILAQSFDQMVSFSAWAESLGRTPSARTLELKRRPVDGEAARKLALEPGTPVYEYKRLRLLDGEPAMVELTTFVEWVGRLVVDCDLDGGSVYAQLGERGVVLGEAHQAIAAVPASAELATLLGVPRRAPLLEVARQTFDPNGAPLEWSYDTYRGDAFAITVHSRVALPRAGVALTLLEANASASG
jgi:GntR family transcriptional regulator